VTHETARETTGTSEAAVVLRRAVAADAEAAAGVWLRSFAAALPTVVRPRSDDEVRWYFREVLVPQAETWVVNESAHRFYERHGFEPVEHTDGSGNEEREPDVRYVWPPGRAAK
jgi:hypothetical protein